MAKMFDGMRDGYAQGANGLYLPGHYASGNGSSALRNSMGERGEFFKAISDLAAGNSSDLSTKEKQELDKRLERKIGTLFRVYYNLWNTSYAWGAQEKSASTPTVELLREISRQSLVDRLLINARVFQVRHVCRRVAAFSKYKGWSVRHKGWEDYDFKPTPEIERRCKEMEEIILHPNSEVHGRTAPFRDALVKMTRGELVLDRKVMITLRNAYNKVISWHILPPDYIKPRLQVVLKHMEVFKVYSIDQAVEDIWNRYQVDLTNAAYVQEVDNRIYGAWTADECSVDMVNPSDEMDRWGWGMSPLEESLEATTLLMLGLYYNKQNFLSNYPEAFLFINGDVDDEGLEAFKKQIYAQVGTQGNQRLPVFATGDANFKTELHRLRDSLTDMQFIQLLRFAIALKCAAYRAHPSLINFSPDMGDSKALISSDDQEQVIATAQEEGYHSLLDNQSSWITGTIIEPFYDDLCMVFDVEDRPTEAQEIDLWTKRLAMGDLIDEWRSYKHRPTLAEATKGKLDGAIPNSPFPLQYQEYYDQKAAGEQQQAMEQQRQSGEGFSGMEQGPEPKELQGR